METIKLIKDSFGHYVLVNGGLQFDFMDEEWSILVEQHFVEHWKQIKNVGIYIFYKHLNHKSCFQKKQTIWNFILNEIKLAIWCWKN